MTKLITYARERLREIADWHESIVRHSDSDWHDDVAETLREILPLLRDTDDDAEQAQLLQDQIATSEIHLAATLDPSGHAGGLLGGLQQRATEVRQAKSIEIARVLVEDYYYNCEGEDERTSRIAEFIRESCAYRFWR